MRRRFMFMAALAAAVFAAAGVLLPAVAAGELDFWVYGSEKNDQVEKLAAAFGAKSGIKVNVVAVPKNDFNTVWSAQNEGREVKERAAYIARIAADWRAHYYDGRLLSQSAADAPGPADASQGLCDLAGWTTYFGIFHGSTYYEGTADFLDRARRHFPGKPILATEFGLWSFPDGRNHEEQRRVFQETMKAFIERLATSTGGCVAGMTWWTAFDWFSTNTGLQSMGLCGMDRAARKPVWEDLARTYRDLARAGFTGDGSA